MQPRPLDLVFCSEDHRFVSRLKGTVQLKIKTVIYSSSCFFKSQLADFVLVSLENVPHRVTFDFIV